MHTLQISAGHLPVSVTQVRTPDLGDHSYVVVVGDRAVVVDPQRDIDRMNEALGGARLVAVFETHIHNDYVTGGHLLAGQHGAEYVLPTDSGAAMEHRAIGDGGCFDLGSGWSIVAVHTPGHTLNHTSYELVGPNGPVAVLSGGSMLVGAVGRSDLLGPDLTEPLARHQFRSVRMLADTLPGDALVAPTHGAGSFCSASAVADTTSTIDLEKARNPALLEEDEDRFVETQVAGYRLHPAYYAHMGPANLQGVTSIDWSSVAEVTPEQLDDLDAEIVDVRPAVEWAAGHIPGSLNVPARDDTAQYIGWVLPWNSDLVLVGPAKQVDEAKLQLARIGYDAIVGAVTDDLAAWKAQDRPVATARVARFADLAREEPATVVDVRDPIEFADAHLDGAAGVHVSKVPAAAPFGDDEVWLYCATGYRASIAAGFVERSGRSPVIVLDSWEERGRPLVASAQES